jgi:hypothetical protein
MKYIKLKLIVEKSDNGYALQKPSDEDFDKHKELEQEKAEEITALARRRKAPRYVSYF